MASNDPTSNFKHSSTHHYRFLEYLFPRREQGNCRICWYAASATDVQLSGKNTKTAKAVTKESSCCGYGSNGMKSTGPYDCIVIPGIIKAADSDVLKAVEQCGGGKGLATATNTASTTVCCKLVFHNIEILGFYCH